MGRAHPVGIILAAILFGMLYQGGAELAFDKPKISRDMIVVIQGLVVLFAGALEHMFRRPVAMPAGAIRARPTRQPPSEGERSGGLRRRHRDLRLRHPPRRAADPRLPRGPVVGALGHRRHRARGQDADRRLRRRRGRHLHRQRLGRALAPASSRRSSSRSSMATPRSTSAPTRSSRARRSTWSPTA